MRHLRAIVLALALALAGCQLSQRADADPADPLSAGLGEAFVLTGGQDATITGTDLRLRFSDVAEDSRCPKQVECFWTGEARIGVEATLGDNSSTTIEFNTNPAPGMTKLSAPVGQFAIDLRALDPYPETPHHSIELADYRATLLVRKGG